MKDILRPCLGGPPRRPAVRRPVRRASLRVSSLAVAPRSGFLLPIRWCVGVAHDATGRFPRLSRSRKSAGRSGRIGHSPSIAPQWASERPLGLLGSVPFASHRTKWQNRPATLSCASQQKEPGENSPRGQTNAPNLPRRHKQSSALQYSQSPSRW
jgi:hypothetical protein